MGQKKNEPAAIQIRGARVHNLKSVDVDIPLGGIVGIAGVSGTPRAPGGIWRASPPIHAGG